MYLHEDCKEARELCKHANCGNRLKSLFVLEEENMLKTSKWNYPDACFSEYKQRHHKVASFLRLTFLSNCKL